MRLLADEGVDAAVVERLRSSGHEVVYIAELAPGITDEQVLERARADGRVLVTADKDFGELVFRLREAASGVLLIRLPGLAPASKAEAVVRAVTEHCDEMEGAFTVLSHRMVRIRPRP